MQRRGVVSHPSLSLFAATFESFDLERLLLVCVFIFGISMSNVYVEVIGSRSRSREQKAYLCFLFVGGRPSIERISCCEINYFLSMHNQ